MSSANLSKVFEIAVKAALDLFCNAKAQTVRQDFAASGKRVLEEVVEATKKANRT